MKPLQKDERPALAGLCDHVWVIRTRCVHRIRQFWTGPAISSAVTMRGDDCASRWVLAYCRTFFIGRHRLGLEVAALRQKRVVFKRKQPRPRLCNLDRALWVGLRRLRPRWGGVLIIVNPDTVVPWHRAGFRLFWRWRSRPQHLGRPSISVEVQQFDSAHEVRESILGRASHRRTRVSEPTVSRYLQRLKHRPDTAKVQLTRTATWLVRGQSRPWYR